MHGHTVGVVSVYVDTVIGEVNDCADIDKTTLTLSENFEGFLQIF